MTKIVIDKALIEQAIDALADTQTDGESPQWDIEKAAYDALRAALAEPAVGPFDIAQIASDRYKVVEAHESMFYRWAVVAGDGKQQLYIGREVECQNMARKFTGAFLDGAWLASQSAPPPAEVPLLTDDEIRETYLGNGFTVKDGQHDLKPYVFASARAIEAAVRQKAGL